MRLSTVKTLAICLVATFSACDNKQPKANENTDSGGRSGGTDRTLLCCGGRG